MHHRLSSCHLDLHRHSPYVLTPSRVSRCRRPSQLTCHAIENRPTCQLSHRDFPNIHPSGFYRGIGPPVPMSCHLRIPYRIVRVCSNLQHVGWGEIPAHPNRSILSLKNSFQRKSPEKLVSARSPRCDTRMCHKVIHLGHRSKSE